MAPKPSFFLFVGLNLQRLASIVATILVFAATIKIMVEDGRTMKAIHADRVEFTDTAGSTVNGTSLDCEYYEGTDVPTHSGGLFWAQLDRLFILALLLLCLFAEISWSGICDRFFNWGFPILGPSFGTAPLGLLQMFIASILLSHYLDSFELGVSWFLFIVGALNLVLGGFFHAPIKDKRSIFAVRRERAKQRDLEYAGPLPKRAKGASSPQPIKAMHAFGKKSRATLTAPPIASSERPQIIRNALDAFPSLETGSQQEMLRQRAREANARLERLRASAPASGDLANQFEYDAQADVVQERVATAQAGANADLASPRHSAFGRASAGAASLLSAAAKGTRRRSASFVRKARHRVSSAPSTTTVRSRSGTERHRSVKRAPPLPSARNSNDVVDDVQATNTSSEMVQVGRDVSLGATPRPSPSSHIASASRASIASSTPRTLPPPAYRTTGLRSATAHTASASGTGGMVYPMPVANKFVSEWARAAAAETTTSSHI